MSSKKTVVFAVFATVLGFIGTSAYLGTLPLLQQRLAEEAQPLIQFGQSIYTRWTNLPQAAQSIILAGVPTLFMVFFAWTKTRAMKKVEETELQSRIQYNQLTGEIGEAKQQLEVLENQKAELQSQVKAYADGNEAINTLTANLEEATNLVTQKQRQIERLQREVASLTGQIDGMKTQITYKERVK